MPGTDCKVGNVTYSFPTGNYYTAGPYLWDTPEISAPMYEILFGSAPGVAGSYSINLGFRSQDFSVKVLYVNDSAETLISTWIGHMAGWIGPVDCQVGGVTIQRCFVDAAATVNSPVRKLIVQDGGGGEKITYAMYANIKMSCKGVADGGGG